MEKMTDKLRVIVSIVNSRDMGIMRHEVITLLHGLIQGLVLYTSNPPHPANVKIGKFSEGGSCGDLILPLAAVPYYSTVASQKGDIRRWK